MAADAMKSMLPGLGDYPPRDASVRLSGPFGRLTGDGRANLLNCHLCGRVEPEAPHQDIPISSQPFTIGRRPENKLCLANNTVSGRHAELVFVDGRLFIQDLGSTNGTFVNGQRIHGLEPLHNGDRVQIGTASYVLQQRNDPLPGATVAADISDHALAYLQFERLLNEPGVLPYFQPIVRLEGQECLGYEVLARSRLAGLETPDKMFQMAAELRYDINLSCLLRREGMRHGLVFGNEMPMYLNTHPTELGHPELIRSLQSLRDEYPHMQIVLEIHEAAITSSALLTELRKQLTELNIRLAYDDFGAGQARLLEMAEAPPHVIKFDMHLIRGLNEASLERTHMTATLVQMVRRLGAIPLAEGVETEAEAEACIRLGFEMGQGYYFGHPAPAQTWTAAASLPHLDPPE